MGFVRGLGICNCAMYLTGDLWKGAGELLEIPFLHYTEQSDPPESNLTVAFTPPNLYLN